MSCNLNRIKNGRDGRLFVGRVDRPTSLGNGLSCSDVSNVSQDHATTIEPYLADQIKILKGPSTLLFESGAIGGVVNGIDGRIPELAAVNSFSGRVQVNYDTVSNGGTGMFRVDTGNENFVLHFDVVNRDDGDYDIPGRTLPNSYVPTKSGVVGGSVLGDWGFLGLSVSRYLNNYGSPIRRDSRQSTPTWSAALSATRVDVATLLDANNVTNQTQRLATSLIKDQAPLPGRKITVGVRALL